LNNLAEAAALPDAPQWVKDDFAAIQKRYGFEGFNIPTEAHEAFARDGEAYFREGNALLGCPYLIHPFLAAKTAARPMVTHTIPTTHSIVPLIILTSFFGEV
jgi:hypothetical protein